MIRFFPRPKSSAPHPLTKRSRPYIIGIASHASVAELVDAQDLGSCALCMGVRVPSLAPKKHCGSHSAFLLAVTFFAKADLSEIYRLPIVSTFEDLCHSFRICLTRVLRSAGIEDGILSDGILLGKVQLL